MTNTVEDGFESYFREKIWEMIPAYYRHEDGIADNPGVLRAIVHIVAGQAAELRRGHDQLWQDQFIDLCRDWAVPYIGDLLATRLLSSLNSRGRRVDVAKTIYYRRRKGTLGVLEELIGDITGWEGKVVESFRRLARTRHGLDPILQRDQLGRISGTPAGGVPDLRQPWGAQRLQTPFDEYYHTPDFRRHRGWQGRYNIPKLALHLYRIKANRIDSATPFQLDGLRFSYDPSGRDIHLFSPRERADNWHNWTSITAWQLPAPIACRLLNHAEFRLTGSLLTDLQQNFGVSASAIDKLRQLGGERIRGEARLQTLLSLMNEPSLLVAAANRRLVNGALVADCGRQGLVPNAIAVYDAGTSLRPAELAGADLGNWPVADTGRRALVDPARGRLQLFGADPQPLSVDYHYGFAADIGAGSYARPAVEAYEADTEISGGGAIGASRLHNQGTTQINDNRTYGPLPDKLNILSLALQAANGRRPYARLEANWILRCSNGSEDAHVRLDGLWLGASDSPREIILRGAGDFEQVTIRNCSLDPGGARDIAGDLVWPVRLVIENSVETLRIESSIVGQIVLRGGGLVENLEIVDSIVDAAAHADITADADPQHRLALDLPSAEVRLERVTIFGGVNVNRLWATEAIITEAVDVTDTQTGCFRFSSAPQGSRLPRPYESCLVDSSLFNESSGLFSSRIFGHYAYAQLSEAAPAAIAEGAENGSEMGAFSAELGPVKRRNLASKVNEYMPFGLVPLFIYET